MSKYDVDPFDQRAAFREFKKALPARTRAEAARWESEPNPKPPRSRKVVLLVRVVRSLLVLTGRAVQMTCWAMAWVLIKVCTFIEGRMPKKDTMRSGDEPF